MSSLRVLLRRISEGDAAAEEEFVRTYRPHLQRHVRAKLRLKRIRRVSDTSDICQVVMASVLIRSALGRCEIADSHAMRKWLARIADHKLIDLARRREFQVPHWPIGGLGEDGVEPADSRSSLISQLALDELIAKGRLLLTETERAIVELREEGLSWEQAGARLGITGEACRKKFGRAIERVLRDLGLEGPTDG